jgi:hypothetical protein
MDQIDSLLHNNWIYECGGPWGLHIVLAPKPHQEHVTNIKDFVWRMCVSYRKLNAVTLAFEYPILLFCLLYPTTTWATTQDSEIRVEGVTYLAMFAAFGTYDTVAGTLAAPPPTIDPLLCECKYDDSKADKKGERVSPKNIYANPFNPMVCPHLSFGCWFALRKGTFGKNDSLFLGAGQPGSAAQRYCDGLLKLLTEYMEKVMEFVRPGHANRHGFRKGVASYSTSVTTFPASLVSVARRGEWTQGSIFDIYFQFAEPGEQYLGRLNCGARSKFAQL